MAQSERDYLEKRLRTCKQQAREALDPSVARIHRQFADHYAERLEHQAPIPEDKRPEDKRTAA